MNKITSIDLTIEFPLHRELRQKLPLSDRQYSLRGQLMISNPKQARELIHQISAVISHEKEKRSAGTFYGTALISTLFRRIMRKYTTELVPQVWTSLDRTLHRKIPAAEIHNLYTYMLETFPGNRLFHYQVSAEKLLLDPEKGDHWRQLAMEQVLLLRFAGVNSALKEMHPLILNRPWEEWSLFNQVADILEDELNNLPGFSSENLPLPRLFRQSINSGKDLEAQLAYIKENWSDLLGDLNQALLGSLDILREENQIRLPGPGPTEGVDFSLLEEDYAQYSPDSSWMPKVILMAKNALVWMYQLSKKYDRDIKNLRQIPDEELDFLEQAGFTGLWLIGLWERSKASRDIKVLCGNPEAESSAYSLDSYRIAQSLGGQEALDELKARCLKRGIRLASDMVPNHCGIDSQWVRNHPEWFISRKDIPFPQYSFKGENLSSHPDIEIHLEDHYYDRTDCAVVFKRLDKTTGAVDYLYHGNDGTSMPWNDTAQIDFLNPEAREEVIQQILQVAREFPIVRFDAAMVLARKHVQRLWYPKPGEGGAIPTRSDYSLSDEEFYRAMPEEFWREVVERISEECPDTLLLAEAFWMMEGYFVRNLGMHRVYNSAFMNMIKDEKTDEFRQLIKNTLDYDPKILKRYVNFMSNPDEDTAEAQFGRQDKYFSVFALMLTLPGLPMVGHGQLEGYREKYGMEYSRAYYDESPDMELMERHKSEIFPIMKNRRLFAGAKDFNLYDAYGADGSVKEQIIAYTNRFQDQAALFLFNNCMKETAGNIHFAYRNKRNLADSLGLVNDRSRFVIFREHPRGLWYIRNSGEIYEKGLHFHLPGYNYHLFTRFKMVDKKDSALYSALCDLLKGKGTPSIEQALIDYRLKPLYDVIEPFWNSESLDKLVASFLHKQAKLPEFLKNRKNLKLWIKKMGLHLKRPLKPGKITRQFQRNLKQTLNIWNGIYHFHRQEFPGDLINQEEVISLLAYRTMVLLLSQISELSPEELLKQWDILHQFKIRNDKTLLLPFNASTLLNVMFHYRGWSRNKAALERLGSFFDDSLFRKSCGVNLYDQILWYNRQGFEETTTLLFLQEKLDYRGIGRFIRRNRFWSWLEKWLKRHDEAEFRVQHMRRIRK